MDIQHRYGSLFAYKNGKKESCPCCTCSNNLQFSPLHLSYCHLMNSLYSMKQFSRRIDVLASIFASKIRYDAARAVAPRTGNTSPPPHCLTLYDYEASPWCRIVREHMTLLDLNAHIRPCPRQTVLAEGAFSLESRFRPEALRYLMQNHKRDNLTFPVLVDSTNKDKNPVVVYQSFEILQHLWKTYGETVEQTSQGHRRPDQVVSSDRIPFPLRFLLLAGPSFLRPWPRCGIMRTPSKLHNYESGDDCFVLYQAEGCPESRLVREVLCTLEIPYLSISAGNGTAFHPPIKNGILPILMNDSVTLVGSEAATNYLWENFWDQSQKSPSFLDRAPEPNLGNSGSFAIGAWTAFMKGTRSFVPSEAKQ